MRYYIALFLILVSTGFGVVEIESGSTSVTAIYFVFRNTTTGLVDNDIDTTDIDLYYVEDRTGAGDGSLESAGNSSTIAATDAYTSLGAIELGQGGLCRIDFPNGAFDGGVGFGVHLIAVPDSGDNVFAETIEVMLIGPRQTGDSFARIGANGAGLSNIDLPNQTMDISGTLTTVTTCTTTTTNTDMVGEPLTAQETEDECVDALESFNLDTLAGVDTTVAADGDLTAHVVDGSVFSHIMTTGANTSDYRASTEALQALRDWIGDGTNLDETGGDGAQLTEAGGDGDHLNEAGGDGDHLVESGGDGDQLTAINLPNQTMDISGTLTTVTTASAVTNGLTTGNVNVAGGVIESNLQQVADDAVTDNGDGVLEVNTIEVEGGDATDALDTSAATVMADTIGDISASTAPVNNPTLKVLLQYLYYDLFYSKKEVTGILEKIFTDADAAAYERVIGNAAGTTTRGEVQDSN